MIDDGPRMPERNLLGERRDHDRLSATSSDRDPAAPPRFRNIGYWRVFDNDDLHVRSEAPSRRAPAAALGRSRTRRRAPAETGHPGLAWPGPVPADARGRADPDLAQTSVRNPD